MMRLCDANVREPWGVRGEIGYPHSTVLVAHSNGNPRLCLSIRKDPIHDPYGLLVRLHLWDHCDRNTIVVGNQGILQYFQQYVKHLTTGTFQTALIIPEAHNARSILLFPDAGDAMSACVTHGIEVRTGARWFPSFSDDGNQHHQRREEEEGLNFGYIIRFRMVDLSIASTWQLLSLHLEVVNGYGVVHCVDREAVPRKQPLLFLHDDQSFGYHDLGLDGTNKFFTNMVFSYQRQTGPVAGTTRQDTHGARVRGFFRFVPGSLEQPEGPPFNVTVPPIPLTIPFPFY